LPIADATSNAQIVVTANLDIAQAHRTGGRNVAGGGQFGAERASGDSGQSLPECAAHRPLSLTLASEVTERVAAFLTLFDHNPALGYGVGNAGVCLT
jgi:hypothetical protein